MDNAGNYNNNASSSSVFRMDLHAPNAVSNLSALASGLPGEVELNWTVPDENGITEAAPSSYLVKHASYPFDSGSAPNLTSVNVSADATNVHDTIYATVDSLTDGVTYYFRIFAIDNVGNTGPIDTGTTAYAIPGDSTPPEPISDLTAAAADYGEITLTWTVPHEDMTSGSYPYSYDIRYATYPFDTEEVFETLSSTTVLNGTTAVGESMSATIGGFTTDVVYYFRIKSIDDSDNESDIDTTATQASSLPGAIPPTTIKGVVKQSDGRTITGVLADIYDGSALSGSDYTDKEGTYLVENLTKVTSYKVVVSWTVDEVTSSVYREGVLAGSSSVDFTLEVSYELAGVSGVVMLAKGGGTSGAYSAPTSQVSGGYVELYRGGRKIISVYTDSTGKYTIPNLLPGKYMMRAFNGLSFSEMKELTLDPGMNVQIGFTYDLLNRDKVYFYPNPARDQVTIRFESIIQPIDAQVYIFDITGALVRELQGSLAQRSGAEVSWDWDLTNNQNERIASGIYLVQVKVRNPANGQIASVIKKLAIVR